MAVSWPGVFEWQTAGQRSAALVGPAAVAGWVCHWFWPGRLSLPRVPMPSRRIAGTGVGGQPYLPAGGHEEDSL